MHQGGKREDPEAFIPVSDSGERVQSTQRQPEG
ncbi:addiction module toxin RelE [Escherichia coli]|nr:addiction module toxin RelE [Escherichia coli]EFO2625616.1 addiction module toxin RelE [Escherichia coli]EFO3831392.1 addiction module toxin RelE [Escherichia coli]EFO3875578.1 addiction module toxin RelE [Escherichia coli]TXX17581.1 addiction module toxin RelE [Escherichia coli]